MKYTLIPLLMILCGCSTPLVKHPKTCYELKLNFTDVNSKQIVCTTKPLNESYNFTRINDD